jgi:DMSO reductase iron-sulfur subunit
VTQYGFFIDLSRCIGCNACLIACKQWHDLEPGPAKWMRVYQWEKGSFPQIDLHVLPIPCFHCAKPVCAEACPNQAIAKEEKYGAVLVDSSKCDGQRKCREACPYGAPQFGGDAPGIKMSKCTMCIDRLEQGLAPICVLSCSMRALEFGPIDALREKYGGPLSDVREGFSQCRVSCPAHLDAGGYIKRIAEGKAREALDLFREGTPFAGVLGRVCTHPCEVDCLRGQFDDSVPICSLKRYIAESEFEGGRERASRVMVTHQERIAIVGSGPAGLACAYDLVRQGYRVTVFEAESKSGGLLRYGIPDYRLPKNMLDDEISFVEELGAEIKTDSRIENVESLFDQGYKALFIATGAWQNMKLSIPGEESRGVLYALDFLRQANSDEKVSLGDKVIVIGGGSVAVDAARLAKRQEGAEVHLVCLECRDFASNDRMLAQPDEVEEAEEEGVILHPCQGVRRILTREGKVTGLELVGCVKVRERDGTFDPIYDETDTSTLEADSVIVAIGQLVGPFAIPAGASPDPSRQLAVDPVTLETGIQGIFAGGDVVGGAGDVISAIAAGKAAAVSIIRYLGGEDLSQGRTPTISMRMLPATLQSIASDSGKGWGEKLAIEQAKRCLNCDITVPSVVFKTVDPKKQVLPWDARKALDLWQKRHPDDGQSLPDVFSHASEVTRDASDITGRNRLVLKPESSEQLMYYTTDDE